MATPKGDRNLTAKFQSVQERHEEYIKKKIAVCPIRPIFVSMAISGLVPIELTPPYFPSKSLFRSTLLYCIAVNIVVAFSTFRMLCKHLPEILEVDITRHLSSRLQCLNALLAIGPISLVPIVWCLCSDYGAKVALSCRFQSQHEEITGKEWDSTAQNHQNRVLTFMIYIMNLAVFGAMAFFQDVTPEFLPAFFQSSLVCHNATLWYITWLRNLRKGAEQVLDHLKTPLKGQTATHIQGARRLWIGLRERMDASDTLSSLISLILGFLFLVLTLSLYQIIQLQCQGHTDNAVREGFVCFAMLVLIFILCNESHQCMTQLNECFIRSLDHISLDAKGEESSKAIQLFYLSITAKPARTSLIGFMDCNRSLMSTILSATLTYLVVLIQFRGDEKLLPLINRTLSAAAIS